MSNLQVLARSAQAAEASSVRAASACKAGPIQYSRLLLRQSRRSQAHCSAVKAAIVNTVQKWGMRTLCKRVLQHAVNRYKAGSEQVWQAQATQFGRDMPGCGPQVNVDQAFCMLRTHKVRMCVCND